MSEKTLAKKLQKMDPRAVYILLLLVIIAPIVTPIGLPIPISAPTRDMHRIVEGLPAGSRVWYGLDAVGGMIPELLPAMVVTVRHLFTKPVKVVFVSINVDGPVSYGKVMGLLKVPSDKKYGDDYVFMGYVPGDETAIAALAGDFRATVRTDYFGTPIDSLPALKDVKTAKDFALVLTANSMSPWIDSYVRQIYVRYAVKVAVMTTGSNYPEKIVYYPLQIVGMLNGMKGAAEYEGITGFRGSASSAMDAFSTAQTLLVVLVVVANIGYFASKRKTYGGT